MGGQGAELDGENKLKAGALSGEPSLGIKYSFSSNLSLEVSLNPDFSQVEADADQIDVNTTFALYYPEKRPFFNAGAELFDTWIEAIYTRSINNPLVAGRIMSQSNKNTFSFLSAMDEDSPYIIPAEEKTLMTLGKRSVSNIFRYRRSLNESSFIGALVTDRRMLDGGAGSTVGIDTRYRFNDSYQVEIQGVFSRTEEPNDSLIVDADTFDDGKYSYTFDGETFSGNAVEVEFSRNTKHWNLEAGYDHMTPTFRADNGFISKNNSRRIYVSSFLHFWPNGKILSEFRGNFYVGETRNFEGETKKQSVSAWSQLVLPRQLRLNFNFNFIPLERFHNTNISDQYSWNINFNSQFSKKIMFGGGLNMGVEMARSLEIPEKGNSLAYWGWGQLKATEKFIILPEYSFFKLTSLEDKDGEYEGFVARLKLNYQFNPALSIRLVGQYNDFSKSFDLQPLLSYRPNPFTIFYIGSSQDMSVDGGSFSNLSSGKTTARQYFMKFQYLFKS